MRRFVAFIALPMLFALLMSVGMLAHAAPLGATTINATFRQVVEGPPGLPPPWTPAGVSAALEGDGKFVATGAIEDSGAGFIKTLPLAHDSFSVFASMYLVSPTGAIELRLQIKVDENTMVGNWAVSDGTGVYADLIGRGTLDVVARSEDGGPFSVLVTEWKLGGFTVSP